MTWLLEKLIAPFAPWLIAALLVANAVTGVMYWHRGNVIRDRDAALATVMALGEQAKRDKDAAETKAKAQQQKDEADYDALMETYTTDLADVNQRLQNRPRRSDVPQVSTECASHAATGAELSRDDAKFLVRLADRADKVTAQLGLCQKELQACTVLSK
jgi:flagellum-specific peptidoglycan hydrolase FlgJ